MGSGAGSVSVVGAGSSVVVEVGSAVLSVVVDSLDVSVDEVVMLEDADEVEVLDVVEVEVLDDGASCADASVVVASTSPSVRIRSRSNRAVPATTSRPKRPSASAAL